VCEPEQSYYQTACANEAIPSNDNRKATVPSENIVSGAPGDSAE